MTYSSKKENDYESQLEEIATEVDSYIAKTDGALENFREQIKPLVQRWKIYYEAVDKRKQELSDHWQRVKKKPELQDEDIEPSEEMEWDRFYLGGLDSFGSNPINEMPAKHALDVMAAMEEYLEGNEKNEQGYLENSNQYKKLQETIIEQRQNLEDIRSGFDELSSDEKKIAWIKTPPKTVIPNKIYEKFMWWRYLNLQDENVFGCWRPPLTPLPEEPLKILKPVESGHQRYKTRKELPDVNAQESRERYYIFLSSVHDNYLSGVEKITKGVWPNQLVISVLCCLDEGHGDKTAFLKAAVSRVCQLDHKANKKEGGIEPKPPETFAEILWVCKNWRTHWKLIFVGIIIILIPGIFVLPKINLSSKEPDGTASTTSNSVATTDEYYRPLSLQLARSIIDDLKELRGSYSNINIILDTESNNINLKNLEDELHELFGNAGFSVNNIDGGIMRGSDGPPIRMLVDSSNTEFAEKLSGILKQFIEVEIPIEKRDFEKDVIKIFINGEPSFNSNGVVSFR